MHPQQVNPEKDDISDNESINSDTQENLHSNTCHCRPFDNSTHGYMIYAESLNTGFVGLLVIILQYILYIMIIYEGFSNRDVANQEIPVTITQANCETNYYINTHWLECSAPRKSPGFMYLAMLTCSIYLFHDFTASIKLMIFEKNKWSKFTAFLILIEALLATIAASLYSWLAVLKEGGFEAIMNTVGILFIHELDYKLFDAIQLIDTKELQSLFGTCFNHKKSKNICITGCTLIFIAVFVLITVDCFSMIFEIGMVDVSN